jgi:hypothetical protein
MNHAERLKKAIADAAARLSMYRVGENEVHYPGDLYVCDDGIEGSVEWLHVRDCPDDNDLVLLVPVDDFPLEGCCDVNLDHCQQRPMVARCGAAVWVPKKGLLKVAQRVTRILDGVTEVSTMMAHMARGEIERETDVDDDPEYEHWMWQVLKGGRNISRQMYEGWEKKKGLYQ